MQMIQPMDDQERAVRLLIDGCNKRIAEASREREMLLALLPKEEAGSGRQAVDRAVVAFADIRDAVKRSRRIREARA